MATIKLKGFDEYVRKLEHLESYAYEYVGKAIYGGAEMMANSVKNALWHLPVDNRGRVDMRRSISYTQKMGLIESFGIAKLREDGSFYNVKLGFDGYNEVKTHTYPNGQPNVMIARALESGTSFMPKNPVISKTVKRKEKDVVDKMENIINKEIEKLMK